MEGAAVVELEVVRGGQVEEPIAIHIAKELSAYWL
jgi:hypothetical protein